MAWCHAAHAARRAGARARDIRGIGDDMATNLLKHGVLERDLRIDFFRGLALCMILVDHVAGDPISRFTYQKLGFSDATEIFVFLSGISCGIVYSRMLARRSWNGLAAAIIRRSMLIYAYYVSSSIVIIILLLAASRSIENAGAVDQSLIILREDFFPAIWSTIFLISPPDLPGILVVYIVLTLVVIPLFLMGAARNVALTLAVSGFIWTISQFHSDLAPRLADHSYLNPLAWQFLFSIGMFIGIRYYDFDWSGLRSTLAFKWLLAAAWVIVVGSFLYRFSFFLWRFQVNLDWLRTSGAEYIHMKETLSAVRLLHFLSIVLLLANYVTSSNPIFGWPGAAIVTRTGRHSLEVFSVSAILSVVLNIIVAVYHPSVLERLGFDGIAMLLMATTAFALSEIRRRRKRAAEMVISGSAYPRRRPSSATPARRA
jgi:hypothetical protein